MLDPFDYKEPACALCGGEAFYNYDPNKQQGTIPVDAVICKLDAYLAREDYTEGARILRYWVEEAQMLRDRRGELSVQNEILGLSRRIGDKTWGLSAVSRCLQLIAEIGGEGLLSTATILLNAALTSRSVHCLCMIRQRQSMKKSLNPMICASPRFTTILQQR